MNKWCVFLYSVLLQCPAGASAVRMQQHQVRCVDEFIEVRCEAIYPFLVEIGAVDTL